MTDTFGTPLTPAEPPKKSNTTVIIIVAVVAFLLICCCCGLVSILWTYGDQIMSELGLYY